MSKFQGLIKSFKLAESPFTPEKEQKETVDAAPAASKPQHEIVDFSKTAAPSNPSAGSKIKEPTLIGEHITVEGTVSADEDIIIEGSLKGSIIVKSHQLTIGKKGRVDADVQVNSIVISGHMTGSIVAFEKVQVMRGADFNGQIKAKSIAVEDGSFLKASIELDKEGSEKSKSGNPPRVEAVIFPAPGKTAPAAKNEAGR